MRVSSSRESASHGDHERNVPDHKSAKLEDVLPLLCFNRIRYLADGAFGPLAGAAIEIFRFLTFQLVPDCSRTMGNPETQGVKTG
jgi:hypothetical protein